MTTPTLRRHAHGDGHDRRLFSLAIGAASIGSDDIRIDVGSKHFTCFLAWDADGASVESVSELVELLLRAGASYFVCWGKDCERVHDIIDETISHPDSGLPSDATIMTTWHSDEPLAEALQFFLVLAKPDERYAHTTRAGLAVVVDSPEWEKVVAAALDDPRTIGE